MEKPGMGRGYRFRGTRLLILFLSLAPGLSGQSAEVPGGESSVLVESSPARPVLEGSWRITILVDHPVPEEVTVVPPDLPSSLTFAQSRKETRFIRNAPDEGRRFTLVEFLYVPHRTGAVTLGPFEILTPAFRIRTEELTVTVQGGAREYHPRLVWAAPPAALSIGESAELSLRILDWEPGRDLRPGPFHATAPVEALLEELPLTKADTDQGRVLRLRVTPLEGTRVTIGPFTLRFDTLRLETPAVSIRLTPPAAAPETPAAAVPAAVPPQEPQRTAGPPPFPDVRDEPFPLFRKAYGETLDRARELWGRARYAEALGELRRGERDLFGGPKLVPVRRAAEQALGLPQTAAADETWRPRNLFPVGLLLFIILQTLGVLLRKGAGKKGVPLVLAGILALGIAGLARGLEKTAPEVGYLGGGTLRACTAYRVPDIRGAVSARWMEGQPVRVRAAADRWAYAESPDGDAGWVRQDNIVFY